MFGMSRPTLDRLIGNNPTLGEAYMYMNIRDDDVDTLVYAAKQQLPLAGERMIIGSIKSKGYATL